jgi:hypothetical protein
MVATWHGWQWVLWLAVSRSGRNRFVAVVTIFSTLAAKREGG